MHSIFSGGPKSKSSGLGAASREDFLATFIQQLGLDRPIIVSPSMSGDFSLPFLLGKEPEQAVTKCRGYVPVAPVSTGNYYTQMPKCQVRYILVLIITPCWYGHTEGGYCFPLWSGRSGHHILPLEFPKTLYLFFSPLWILMTLPAAVWFSHCFSI